MEKACCAAGVPGWLFGIKSVGCWWLLPWTKETNEGANPANIFYSIACTPLNKPKSKLWTDMAGSLMHCLRLRAPTLGTRCICAGLGPFALHWATNKTSGRKPENQTFFMLVETNIECVGVRG